MEDNLVKVEYCQALLDLMISEKIEGKILSESWNKELTCIDSKFKVAENKGRPVYGYAFKFSCNHKEEILVFNPDCTIRNGNEITDRLILMADKGYSYKEGDLIYINYINRCGIIDVKSFQYGVRYKIRYFDETSQKVITREADPLGTIIKTASIPTEDQIQRENEYLKTYNLNFGVNGFEKIGKEAKPGDYLLISNNLENYILIVSHVNKGKIYSAAKVRNYNDSGLIRFNISPCNEEWIDTGYDFTNLSTEGEDKELNLFHTVRNFMDKNGYYFDGIQNCVLKQIEVNKGDILMEDTDAVHKNPFIFDHWDEGCPVAVCGLGDWDQFVVCNGDQIWTDYTGIVKATPDQVEKLLSKMCEAVLQVPDKTETQVKFVDEGDNEYMPAHMQVANPMYVRVTKKDKDGISYQRGYINGNTTCHDLLDYCEKNVKGLAAVNLGAY
jgi:hypothetical protein